MDSKEKTKNVGKSKETGFGFPSGDCQAMFEKMSTCCGDESNVIDCCSIMERVMEEKSRKSKGGDKTEK
jgi:hypothetical protein